MDLHELTLDRARELLKSGQISSTELTRCMLDKIDAHDGRVGAFITVDKVGALSAAAAADKRLANKEDAPLLGVPVSLKDLICTRGIKTTCASKILENFVPDYDATVVALVKQAGAVIVGKTNMDEFAMGSSTENSGFHVTRNPWNLDCVPGGSSGGSAAAVAAGMCMASLGSDTGGSIRQPASHCGVVGLKPSYGRVSRFGLVAYASSLDQIGPITRTVKDAALVMNVIAGNDPKDSTSAAIAHPVDLSIDLTNNRLDFTRACSEFHDKGLVGMTAGIPREYVGMKGLDPEVELAFNRACKVLEGLGVKFREVSLAQTDYAVAAYHVLASSEASANLARFDGVRYGLRAEDCDDLLDMYQKSRSRGFGPEVKRRIIMGTYALSAGYYDEYYGRASRVRSLIMADLARAFEVCDILVSPVTPTPAFKIDEKVANPLTMYLQDIFTLSANMAGIPGLSVPSALSSNGLPMGLQILGRRFDEMSVLRVGYGFEQSRPELPGLPNL